MGDWMQHIEKMIPGFAGSAIAIRYMPGKWYQRLTSFGGSLVFAWYIPPWMMEITGIPERIGGLLVGLFAMVIVNTIFIGWETLGLPEMIREYLRKKLGLDK